MREGAAKKKASGIQHNGVNSQELSSALTKRLGVNERRTTEFYAYFSDENENGSHIKHLMVKKQFKYTLLHITLIKNRQYRKIGVN